MQDDSEGEEEEWEDWDEKEDWETEEEEDAEDEFEEEDAQAAGKNGGGDVVSPAEKESVDEKQPDSLAGTVFSSDFSVSKYYKYGNFKPLQDAPRASSSSSSNSRAVLNHRTPIITQHQQGRQAVNSIAIQPHQFASEPNTVHSVSRTSIDRQTSTFVNGYLNAIEATPRTPVEDGVGGIGVHSDGDGDAQSVATDFGLSAYKESLFAHVADQMQMQVGEGGVEPEPIPDHDNGEEKLEEKALDETGKDPERVD